MNVALNAFTFTSLVVALTACGIDFTEEKEKPKAVSARSSEQVAEPLSCPQPSSVQVTKNSTNGIVDFIGQLLKNPNMVQDVIKVLSNIMANGENSPLGAILSALQGGDSDDIKSLLEGDNGLAEQIARILSELNPDTALSLQANCEQGTGAPADP